MLRPDALHVQLLCQLVQPSVQIGAELHQILHVEDNGKITLAPPSPTVPLKAHSLIHTFNCQAELRFNQKTLNNSPEHLYLHLF